MVHYAFNCSWRFLVHSPHVLDPPESQDSENKPQILHYSSIFSAATVCDTRGRDLLRGAHLMQTGHAKTFRDVLLDLPSKAEGELLTVKLQEFGSTPDSESSTLTVCESGQYTCGLC
jgi:hypothetical protein